jgi:hypothetical protein
MTTRTVSPKPLSDFVPDVTLIAFPIPRRDASRARRALFARESLFASRHEKDPDSDVESQFRHKPEFALGFVELRVFRPLFVAAQSTASSKLANPLKNFGFLVPRQTVG